MHEHETTIQTIKASDVRQQWSRVLNQVFRGHTRLLVEKSGIPVAAIISAQDLERFLRYEAERAERLKVIDRMRNAFKDIPGEDLEVQINQAVAEARAALRQERSGQPHTP